MKSRSLTWTPDQGLTHNEAPAGREQLALYFGPRALLDDPRFFSEMREAFPHAMLFGCSSGGHLVGDEIDDEHVSIVAAEFREARIIGARAQVSETGRSRRAGQELAAALDAPELVAVIALTDGLLVNGSELLAGMSERFGRDVPICGGMAGDGADFKRTLVGLDCAPIPGLAAAIGLYGENLKVGWGSAGGWNVFGPQRVVTRSNGAVVEELDGRPALDLYMRYLDERDIAALPGAALLFPLMVRNPAGREENLVRTILGMDRESGSLTFAGDVPRGWRAQLMRGSISSLTQGAEDAGAMAAKPLSTLGANGHEGLALLVSCIGRRLTMGQHTPCEIDAVQARLPAGMPMAGFYSYGEFAPHPRTGACALHNQTMTVMTLAETAA
jgi:hypothetical protein